MIRAVEAPEGRGLPLLRLRSRVAEETAREAADRGDDALHFLPAPAPGPRMTRATKSKAGAPLAPTIPAIPPAEVLGRLSALKTAGTPDLTQQWRNTSPPCRRPTTGASWIAAWRIGSGQRVGLGSADQRVRAIATHQQARTIIVTRALVRPRIAVQGDVNARAQAGGVDAKRRGAGAAAHGVGDVRRLAPP
ncbi:hypothetical protein [Falsiroseomonas tokyonensis]|uniref:Uncharacterized protein n=1 Tax=Falsiroseomonas tokyonensis TaxID=430521 RepID=A0ABV7BYN6_9PROT|nr:hypothetical protein [Falsiroseomonas tokyonensis]MBU8540641.1 hypothetical protein [Falsiroseomonas tokyonensis]